MKKIILTSIYAACLLTVAAQTPNTLWYEQPARNWNEALPIGNGRLGAMVYGNYPNEIIQFNEESLWAGCQTQSDADARSSLKTIQQLLLDGEIAQAAALAEETLKSDPLRIRSYQPVGDVVINYAGSPAGRRDAPHPDYQRKLDLETGVVSSSFVLDGVKYTQEVFASAVHDIIVIRIKSGQAGKLTFKLSLTRKQDATVSITGNNELTMTGQIVDLPSPNSSPAGMHMKFASRIAGYHQGGTLTAVNNSLFVENADDAVFYLTAATDYNFSQLNFDRSIDPVRKCAAILSQVKDKPFESVKTDHVADHAAMFNRVSFNLYDDDAHTHLPTDKRLEAVKNGSADKGFTTLLFQYGRYLLMGSSRKPGILPANLQGVWNQEFDAPWNSDFHTNINIQMNYWPAEVCNLSETVIPLSDLINALRVPGRVTAQKTYHSTGWTMNHLTDVFGRTAISDGVGWGTYPMAASWLALHQWEHYMFTKDLNYLREVYPTMKEAADFVLDFIVRDKNGKWVTAPSNSPENRYRLPNGETYMLTYGATKDIQLIRELFNACIKAGNLLGDDKKYMSRLQSVIKDLPPTKVSQRYGIIQEWIEDYEEVEPGHRHMSQLFGLYPGSEITPANRTLFEAAAKTIARRQEYARKGQGSSTGWSKAWMINFYARLCDGDAAWQKAVELERECILLNLFDTHPPFQIDGNFGFTAGIAEMLIQSHQENLISLLPALPKDWDKGEVKGLKARGNITVDMKWENNRLTSATLLAADDCSVQVKYHDKTQKIVLKKGKEYQLDIKTTQ